MTLTNLSERTLQKMDIDELRDVMYADDIYSQKTRDRAEELVIERDYYLNPDFTFNAPWKD